MPERIDSTDGTAYPLESFLEVYGEEDGRRRWAIAEMWTWKLQNGGLKVTISLAGGGTVSDDEMVRRAAHLGDVMHYGMLLWDGNSPLNMTLDCANRGFGDKGMLALCDALVKIRQPGLCSCLKLYSLRITDASMPHIAWCQLHLKEFLKHDEILLHSLFTDIYTHTFPRQSIRRHWCSTTFI